MTGVRDMSSGAVVDRFYAVCMETGRDPKEFYGAYGGRESFCASVRSFSRGGPMMRPIKQVIKL